MHHADLPAYTDEPPGDRELVKRDYHGVESARITSAYLTIDGQVGEPLRDNDRIECRSSHYSLHLVRPPQQMFFDVLRQKLKWGER